MTHFNVTTGAIADSLMPIATVPITLMQAYAGVMIQLFRQPYPRQRTLLKYYDGLKSRSNHKCKGNTSYNFS